MTKTVETVEQFVEAIGGTARAAEAFGVTSPAVSNWKRFGTFPAWVLGAVQRLADANDLEVAPHLFETTKPGGAVRKVVEEPNEAAE